METNSNRISNLWGIKNNYKRDILINMRLNTTLGSSSLSLDTFRRHNSLTLHKI